MQEEPKLVKSTFKRKRDVEEPEESASEDVSSGEGQSSVDGILYRLFSLSVPFKPFKTITFKSFEQEESFKRAVHHMSCRVLSFTLTDGNVDIYFDR